MKLWVDDIRLPPKPEFDIIEQPEGWLWTKNSTDTILVLRAVKRIYDAMGGWNMISEMSLDHDLGGDDTSRAVVLWCCENDYWPNKVYVHSANPVGIEWLEGMIRRYKT